MIDNVILDKEKLLIAGDFNIHVDDVANGDSEAFLSTFDSYGLSQHVLNTTHDKGDTLDLLSSRSDDNIIKSVSVDDGVAISDHFWIHAELNIHKRPLPKKEISFRKTRNIDVIEFINDISNSAISQSIDEFESATELIIAYNGILTKRFNNHCTPKTKKHLLSIFNSHGIHPELLKRRT